MCTVSMIADHYREKYYLPVPPQHGGRVFDLSPLASPVSREEFDALKRDVEEMKALLMRAKRYDEEHGEPECEIEEKVALVRAVADAVSVDLSEVFGAPGQPHA